MGKNRLVFIAVLSIFLINTGLCWGLPLSNKAGEWEGQFDAGLELKAPPEGMTQEQFEQAIRDVANSYANNDEYFPVPALKDNTSNSNSFIGTILREVYYGGTEAMQEAFKNRDKDFWELLGDALAAIAFDRVTSIDDWNEMFPNAQPPLDYFQGAPGWDTDVTLPENPVDDSSSTESSGDKIICVELYYQGLMDKTIFKADEEFGAYLKVNYPDTLLGYQFWAKPVVKLMKQSKEFTQFVNFFAKPWSIEMAHRMGVLEKGDVVGSILMGIGLPVCDFIGKVFSNKIRLDEIIISLLLYVILFLMLKKYLFSLQKESLLDIVKNSKLKYRFGNSKQNHKKALALLLLVCVCFISTSCNKVKKWLNEGQMEGFWGTNYISPDVSNTKEIIEGSFEIMENDNYTLRLVLTRKDTSTDYRKTGRKLAEFQIEDSEEMIKLIDIVKLRLSNYGIM